MHFKTELYCLFFFQVVVGNILDTRKSEVVIVTKEQAVPIKLSRDELNSGTEIESKIVEELVKRHSDFARK